MSANEKKGISNTAPLGDGGKEYNFREIEKKWQQQWKDSKAYKVSNDSAKPKYYVLDMFPYPSGTGLHVGHPLGYIASDIYARYKRLKGFNVLHPMGFDAFGLPAEQYAIDHGIHPAVSTEDNINTFRRQLDNIGFSFDWDRELRTCDPKYYKWTQWIFLQLFDSWFNRATQRAERIALLIKIFEQEGNKTHPFPNTKYQLPSGENEFSAENWKLFDKRTKHEVLMQYRLAYLAYTEVNWCEALGTVLANDEVINGVSYRGGFPVVKKKMRQWSLRITEYAERLLNGLEAIDFNESMKEIQRNWIGKSSGAEMEFRLTPGPSPGGEGSEEHSGSDKRFKTADTRSWQILKEYGRTNRKNQTEAEDVLWQRIRNYQLGVKVRRQHAIQGYIVDFALLEIKLVIEIDGEYHNEEEQKIYDKARTEYLKEFNLDLIRFRNEEVLEHTDDVIKKIKKAIEEQQQRKVNQATVNDQTPLLRQEKGLGDEAKLRVYTTRPDTIFGVDFMVVAPEHEMVKAITSEEQQPAIDEYLKYVQSRSEVERMAEVKTITGCFTGAYAVNPFDGREIPIWISEYVLAGYGTGAIMGVPCGDERDHKFAKHFGILITNIIGEHYNGEEANPTKDAILQNSDFLNGMLMRDAIEVVIAKIEEAGIGKRQINYKMRDAGWSRQRYWGEPFPIIYKNSIPYAMDEKDLPLELPPMEEFKSSGTGEGPLANAKDWVHINEHEKRDTNTMPTHAGAAWYFLRFMDPHNDAAFAGKKTLDYWGQVDVYIGGAEHAVAHLLYARLWIKVLYDLGYLNFDEPFKKLINQGKITGDSRYVYRIRNTNQFVSAGLKDQYEVDALHVDVNIVDGLKLDTEAFKKWKPDFANAEFILENDSLSSPPAGGGGRQGAYICGAAIEKMSKSYFNVVNPDEVVEKYGTDTFRMYEMFLGPLEASKPWDIKGIEGVHRFLKKLWRLFYLPAEASAKAGDMGKQVWNEDKATDAEWKVLHRTIKKIEDDTERFSFNTGVSGFMIVVNELTDLKCHKREILEPLLILLAPYAPHIAEELYHQLQGAAKASPTFGRHRLAEGDAGGGLEGASILDVSYPVFDPKYLVESSKEYPISVNGKLRTTMNIALDAAQPEVEKIVLENEVVKKWLDGKLPKKIIFVKGKMVNVVV
jgi:leucyl-tRNA synthetase